MPETVRQQLQQAERELALSRYQIVRCPASRHVGLVHAMRAHELLIAAVRALVEGADRRAYARTWLAWRALVDAIVDWRRRPVKQIDAVLADLRSVSTRA